MRFINFNGQIQSEDATLIHAWNRAFRYGDGLFESIAVAKKNIPFIDDHWNRLTEGAAVLSMQLPAGFTKEHLTKSILELAALNAIDGCACARVTLYREGRGRYNPDTMQSGCLVEAEPIRGELFEFSEKGVTIGLFTDAVKSIDRLSAYKTCSALVYVLASVYKTKAGWDDCLILNSRERICDSTNSSVFIVKGSVISTPALSEGCVNGVMRKQIITLAQSAGWHVHETALETEILREADEVFLTNAVRGIRWVGCFGNKQYQNAVALTLSNLLRSFTRQQYAAI